MMYEQIGLLEWAIGIGGVATAVITVGPMVIKLLSGWWSQQPIDEIVKSLTHE